MAGRSGGVHNAEMRGSHPESWTDVVHTGPGTLAGRYLRSFWQPIYRSEDLPAGRAKPIRIMGDEFTLYRGEPPPSLAGNAPPPQSSPARGGGGAIPLPAVAGGSTTPSPLTG